MNVCMYSFLSASLLCLLDGERSEAEEFPGDDEVDDEEEEDDEQVDEGGSGCDNGNGGLKNTHTYIHTRVSRPNEKVQRVD